MSTDDTDIGGPGGRNMLVAEYVLGLLDASAHIRLERRIEDDAALRAERDFWQARFSALDSNFDETTAPAHIRDRVEARLFGTAAKTGFWNNLALWRSLATGALAVAIAAVGFNVIQPAPDSRALANQLVAALEEEGSNVKLVALYDGQGNVRLTSLSGEDVPDRDFELWAIQGDQAPVSMGLIPVNARSEVPLPADVAAGWGEGSVLAITLEPTGGSPSGAPTGPIVAKGVALPI